MGIEIGGSEVDHTSRHFPNRPMNLALATPLLVLGSAFIVIFIGRTFVRLRHRRRLREILQKDDQSSFSRSSTLCAWVKKHVFYAPLFATRHGREFRLLGKIHMGTIPLRLEVILVLVYLTANLVFFFALIDWWENFQEKMYQITYAAGHLAVMNSPGLVLTAGRNNPLITLLGIPFDTFNLLHRWVGRLMIVGSIVHMSCVVAGKVQRMGLEKATHLFWHAPFFIYGMVALIAFVFILFQSMSPVRHAFYETFLHLHILLAVMAFVGLWYHLRGLVQQRVLLATLILWGLDRAGRLASLVWCNCGKKRTTAIVELLPGDVVRVDVAVSRSWSFKAGQYMYLYIPSLGLWTSHPFSVAWTSSDQTIISEKRGSNDSVNLLLGGPQRTTMSFLIKGRDGFTKKLLRKVTNSDDGRFTATALAEGPYGGLHSLASYGTVVLIAGGIGITSPIAYLREFVNGFATRTGAVRRVNLIWIIRQPNHLSWIEPWMTSLLSHPAINNTKHDSYFQFPEFSLSIQIYVTAPPYRSDEFMSDESPWTRSPPASVPVSINYGKPSFPNILDAEMAQQIGAMAVNVCGPGGLGDDVRKSVRERQGTQTVDLYEDSFSW